MKRIVYWFRNDLRLHDNASLQAALGKADQLVPVYVVDPLLFQDVPSLGIRKTGAFRAKFLLEAVSDLRQSLRAQGSDLIVRVGNPAQILTQLAEEVAASAIYANKEVTSEEVHDEASLSKRLKPLNIELKLLWQTTLYHVRDLPFNISQLPNVFTEFRHLVERQATIRPALSRPGVIPSIDTIAVEPGPLPTLPMFGFADSQSAPDVRAAISFVGGETHALARLQHYLWDKDLLRTYKETRNGLLGPDYSSKLSAWLSHGCLSPRLVYEEVRRYETERIKNDSTYWLIFELLWRDYFRFVALKYGNRLFKPSGIKLNVNYNGRQDEDVFWQWADGRTGIPFIDANMRELNATGFMSNRGRQNVSSFLVNELNIDWTWGAAYFESLLVDYDPCSNWGNWNYVAGVGNDPRENRRFNISTQAARYDEHGHFVNHWLSQG